MYNASLVIPIFNEESNIEYLFEELKNPEVYNLLQNIVYVDDCSSDHSLEILEGLAKTNSKIKIIKHKNNLGQSACILSAAEKLSVTCLVTIDGDGQNNPKDIPLLLSKYFLDEDLFLVGGIRAVRKDGIIKRISSRVANKIRKFILNDDCIDTGCSLKVFDRKLFLGFPFFNGIHRFLPALYKGYGKKTFFIDVDHRPRKYGLSKYGTIDRLFRGVRDMFIVVKILKKHNKTHD